MGFWAEAPLVRRPRPRQPVACVRGCRCGARRRREQVGADTTRGRSGRRGQRLARPAPARGRCGAPSGRSPRINSALGRLSPLCAEREEPACQTSALAMRHAMATTALPRVSAARIGNNRKCQKRERMGEGKLCAAQRRADALAAVLRAASCAFCRPRWGQGTDAAPASAAPSADPAPGSLVRGFRPLGRARPASARAAHVPLRRCVCDGGTRPRLARPGGPLGEDPPRHRRAARCPGRSAAWRTHGPGSGSQRPDLPGGNPGRASCPL